MTVSFSTLIRNAVLDAFETAVGTAPRLELRSGAPASADSVAAGTLLATGTLPFDWLAAAAAASKTLLGAWSAVCSVPGTIGHYRLLTSAGVCFESGTYAATGADLNGTVTLTAAGQVVTITAKPYSL